MICIGLLGLGAVLSLRRANQVQDQIAVASPIAPPATITPTPTLTPIPPTPTNSPEPTSTSTLVVGPTAQEAAANATNAPIAPIFTFTPTSEGVPGEDTATPDPNVTPTNTLVLRTPESGTPPPAAAAVNPPAQIPQGGGVLPAKDSSFLIWAGIGVLLLLVLGLVNYLRSPSSVSENK